MYKAGKSIPQNDFDAISRTSTVKNHLLNIHWGFGPWLLRNEGLAQKLAREFTPARMEAKEHVVAKWQNKHHKLLPQMEQNSLSSNVEVILND